MAGLLDFLGGGGGFMQGLNNFWGDANDFLSNFAPGGQKPWINPDLPPQMPQANQWINPDLPKMGQDVPWTNPDTLGVQTDPSNPMQNQMRNQMIKQFLSQQAQKPQQGMPMSPSVQPMPNRLTGGGMGMNPQMGQGAGLLSSVPQQLPFRRQFLGQSY